MDFKGKNESEEPLDWFGNMNEGEINCAYSKFEELTALINELDEEAQKINDLKELFTL